MTMRTGRELEQIEREWLAWQEIVKRSIGVAITADDWSARPDSTGTPGLMVIAAIKEWGEALVALRQAEAERLR